MKPVKAHVVVVDDDEQMRALLCDMLQRKGHSVTAFPLAVKAYQALVMETPNEYFDTEPDLVLTDMRMPEMDGMQFMEQFRRKCPNVPVILITGFGSIETAIQAMQKGAFDYITKPFKMAEIGVTLERAIRFHQLHMENNQLREQVKEGQSMGNLIGKSKAMKDVFDLVRRVARASANVLITGESGSGKEMVARAIHSSGPRSQKPFVAINCTAIPDTLLESELFGHAKGSFTGAIGRKIGLFEEAEGGTIFLDEIGDMDLSLQAKLLRVLQEKTIKPVGDNQNRSIDVRIIAATHMGLKEAIKEGHFREDLYYRLSVIPIQLPSLRERKDDIPLLAEHFLKKYANANQFEVTGFTKSALHRLMNMKWEGNVRELENVIERAVVLSESNVIDTSDLPADEGETTEDFFGSATMDLPTLQELEKRYIKVVLDQTGHRKERAAQILGINRRTLYRKEREYGFVDPDSSMEDSKMPSISAPLDLHH